MSSYLREARISEARIALNDAAKEYLEALRAAHMEHVFASDVGEVLTYVTGDAHRVECLVVRGGAK